MSFEAFGFQPEPPLNLPTICPGCEDGEHEQCEPEFEAQGWICECECTEHRPLESEFIRPPFSQIFKEIFHPSANDVAGFAAGLAICLIVYLFFG